MVQSKKVFFSASFLINMVLDGISYSFGILMEPMKVVGIKYCYLLDTCTVSSKEHENSVTISSLKSYLNLHGTLCATQRDLINILLNQQHIECHYLQKTVKKYVRPFKFSCQRLSIYNTFKKRFSQ